MLGRAGAKSVDQIYEAFEKMYPVLIDFRKGDARQVRALTAPTPAAAPTPRAMPPPATPQLENGAVPRAPTLAQVRPRSLRRTHFPLLTLFCRSHSASN